MRRAVKSAAVSTACTTGLATLVGYSLFDGLLGRNPASSVVPFVLTAPPVAMASAWLLLDEVPNAAELTGGLVVLVGVLVATRGRTIDRGPVPEPAERAPRWASADSGGGPS